MTDPTPTDPAPGSPDNPLPPVEIPAEPQTTVGEGTVVDDPDHALDPSTSAPPPVQPDPSDGDPAEDPAG